ncbi:DNA gyrase inhibitor YacG [Corallincola platygyrae]|uniref:DNA gyrase inhibitor YacG n=1 Tax=Corallincola platygyrae TaxID=1193278 RepID=A0ABW4XNB3_9GAMM
MTKAPLQVECPTCSKQVEWSDESLFRPFCSKRCQLIDLGQWADEENKISVKEDTPSAEMLQDVDAMSDEEIEALAARLLQTKQED